MMGGVGWELIKGDFVVRAERQSRAHKAGDERGRLREEALQRAGLEGLGEGGEEGGRVFGAQGVKLGVEAAEDHVFLVLDLAAGAEAAHALRALEERAHGAAPRRWRG
jgi:hypothetical protein